MYKKYRLLYKLFLFRIWEIVQISTRKKWILSRTACLGNDSLALINSKKYKILNFQKLRVDSFSKNIQGKYNKINFFPIDFIQRDDIKYLFIQQKLLFPYSLFSPSYFVMDSYSELTDQKFFSQKNKNDFFNLNYSDINDNILESYVCDGLLPINELQNYYETFFNLLKKKYPNIKIIFIYFPDLFETRNKFKERHKAIRDSIFNYTKSDTDIFVIELPVDKVIKDPNDDFPYHYSKETYSYVSSILNQIIF